jgi:hypothetical protein
MWHRLSRGDKPNPLEVNAVQIVLGMVERMSVRDTGSPEMLHFDYQVCAVKRQKS